ncbi:DUF1513 domain-containing protein [Aurantimonas aggregata]|uniref:DUF1513 domain-containing protein n=1 Tax=Aurantimonas aggregata TaxID=2047720 RepID=A0A6L9ME31_9HYPH|nr:DUF1513 domain-containing protein [Aurantimonas aggregata]NDV85832.1 DUF1513 domain-containing protein [Aurantimonas aggregata]
MAFQPLPLGPGPLVDRRSFLAGAGAAFVAGLGPRSAAALDRADALFGASCRRPDGSYGCAVFSDRGEIVSTVALPERGHDIAFNRISGRAVVFARRPRTFAVVFDPASGRTLQTLTSPGGRHFFGHGFFSPDGALLYATENDYDGARGMIGVYDVAAGYRRIGEFASHGMDTHEALLMPDGETIVVANGGIETHPDYGRQMLNIPTMEPSIAFIDRRSGDLIDKQLLPQSLHKLSLHHIAIDARQRVWFGGQYQGPAGDAPPLVGFAEAGQALTLTEMAPTDLAGLGNYIGSVATSRDGARVAVSSPVGNTTLILAATTGDILSRHAIRDGCGLAPDGSGFLATSGGGDVIRLEEDDRPTSADLEWDNHILALDALG